MKFIKKILLGNEKNIEKSSFVWNIISGMINAIQSAIIMSVIAHFIGRIDAGIFSFAYALANLLLNIGHFNVRNYQVTDQTKKYSFSDYFHLRMITFSIMILTSVLYIGIQVVFGNYDIRKSLIVFLIIILKGVDCVEDVFYGQYQQFGRLDVGGKCMSIRLTLTTFLLCTLVIFKFDFLLSLIITNIFNILFMLIIIFLSSRFFDIQNDKIQLQKVQKLFKECFGLFIVAFLSFYILNASKYSLDIYGNDESQAYYGYLTMPVFCIALINNFLYQPILKNMASEWENKQYSIFSRRIYKQVIQLIILMVIIILLGNVIGLKILSIMYNCDLSRYRLEFNLLLIAGSFYAYVGFISVVLTILRKQKKLAYIYIGIGIVTVIISNIFVIHWGILGASLQYCISLLLCAIIVSFVAYREIKIKEE